MATGELISQLCTSHRQAADMKANRSRRSSSLNDATVLSSTAAQLSTLSQPVKVKAVRVTAPSANRPIILFETVHKPTAKRAMESSSRPAAVV